jgi:CRISPR-associated protein Csm1
MHVVAFSREMELFFAGWLDHELNQGFKDAYTIFSGGDDLFLLTPWTRALDLARRVNEKFCEFVCANQAVTLSAGILYTKPRYPVARAAPDAEAALELSKHRGRNRLTVLGDTFEWAEIPGILDEVQRLVTFGDKALRSSFLYRLVDYGKMYRQAHIAEKAQTARYKSHFAYTIARNLRDDRTGLRDWADSLLQGLFITTAQAEKDPAQSEQAQHANRTMNHLGVIATIVSFYRRGKQGGNENA